MRGEEREEQKHATGLGAGSEGGLEHSEFLVWIHSGSLTIARRGQVRQAAFCPSPSCLPDVQGREHGHIL